MMTTHRIWLAGLALGTLFLWPAGTLRAQCSGGRDEGMTGSTGRLMMTGPQFSMAALASQRSYENPQMLAMQRQMYQAQQQLLAMRRELNQQMSQQRYRQQQELLALRRQRADQTRARRAERIALAKAKRQSERSGNSEIETRSLYVSTPPETESETPESNSAKLVSITSVDPFSW